MKRLQFLIILAIGSVGAGVSQASVFQDFDLYNRTGYDIREVFVSPHTRDDWEGDVLGGGILPNGRTVHLMFNRLTQSCFWDVKVVYFDDSSDAVWKNLNICEAEKVTIRYDRSSETASATFE
jgi:hypothetical protein